MKKIYLSIILLAGIALGAKAQGVYDAVNFGTPDYLGSARSLGMGNAVTAVGGDLGSITINPAGSAVCGYSQFTISPGLSISSTNSSYSDDGGNTYGYGSSSNRTRFKLPNCGVTLWYDTSWMSDQVKSITFGWICNTTRDYNNRMSVTGITDQTSKFAEMAAASTGISPDAFEYSGAYDNSNLYNYWDAIMAYKMGQISSYGNNNQYVACTEAYEKDAQTGEYKQYIPAQLSQKITSQRTGYQTDMVFNMGFNIDNTLYLGFSLGTPFGSYNNLETINESDYGGFENHPIKFTYANGKEVTTSFKNASYRYNYYSELSGVYTKIGAIYSSNFGLRLGAAVKTRTLYQVREGRQYSGSVAYANGDSYSGKSSEGSYSYSYYSPWEANFGVAYVFDHYGMLSVDYEMTDYSSMAYGNYETGNTEAFYETNEEIRDACRVAGYLRAGLELNVTPAVAVRAGYNLLTSAYKNGYNTNIFTLGAGYKSSGSFFADFAIKYTRLPIDIFTPYGDYHSYIYNGTDYLETGTFYAPKVKAVPSLFHAVLTLGWRF